LLTQPENAMTNTSQPEAEGTKVPDDVESAVQPMPVSPEPPKRQGGATGFLGLVLGGLIAGGIGYGAGQVWPLMQAAGQADLAAIQSEIAVLKSAQAASDALVDPRVDELVVRIDALDGAPMPDLSRIETRLQGVEAVLASGPAPDGAAIKALQDEVARLKLAPPGTFDTTGLQAQADAILANARADAETIATNSRSLAALDRLRAAADSGAPFGASLDNLPEPGAVLTDMDATGIPTLSALRDAFPDAARAALEAAIQADMGNSWTERTMSLLQSSTGARSMTPREGNDPDAILSRVEAALRAGNLPLAMTEIATLPTVAQEAMSGWSKLASSRTDALAAIDALAAKIGG
jgi:hypothetical protein